VWTVVYIAPHKKEAERIKGLLTVEGFLVKLKTVGLTQTQASGCGPVEVLVPESEVEEAMEIINNL